MALAYSHQEWFSNSVLEGMAVGVPLGATDEAENREVVTHEESGLIVPPHVSIASADAMFRLARDTANRERMEDAGRRRA